MGDKKGKKGKKDKDKAKGHRQKEARRSKAANQKQDRR